MSSYFSYILEEDGQVWFFLILETEKAGVRGMEKLLVVFRGLLRGRAGVLLWTDYGAAFSGRESPSLMLMYPIGVVPSVLTLFFFHPDLKRALFPNAVVAYF